ncbi:MAG: sugar transferase [Spirochaetes bacterium]|nr:sugar transferase [Spirochaetota bacterium]
MKEKGLLIDKQQKRQLLIQINRVLDVTLSLLAYIGAFYIKISLLPGKYAGLSNTQNYLLMGFVVALIWYILLVFIIIDVPSKPKFSDLLNNIVKVVTAGIIILVLVLFVLKIHDFSRLFIGIFYILNIIILTASKSLIFWSYKKSEQSEYNKINIIIIGSKERAAGAISLLHSMKGQFNIIGCLDIHKERIGKRVKDDVKVIGIVDDIQGIIISNVVDEVIFAMPMQQIENIEAYIQLIELMGIKVRIFPDWNIHSLFYEPRVAQVYFDELNGIPSMVLSSTTTRHRDLLIKLFADYVISGLMLILLSPILALISLMIKLASTGPVLFKQERVGLNGRKFNVYKFRTMVQDAEEKLESLKQLNEADGPAFKIKNDPRIIPVIGKILRKTSLDELPQLFNIFKGEMSLIGPRPPLWREVSQYNIWHRRRLSMKPGITCIWQIQPNRNDLSFDQWMDLDLEYIDNWSLKLDVKIFFKTIFVMLLGHGR